jgi:hypothetical protein
MVSIKHILQLLYISCIILVSQQNEAFAQTPENTTYIGFGAGSLSFIGDVGDQNRYFSPFLGRVGYQLSLSNELTPYLHGGLEAMFGTVGASERLSSRNLNFFSEIRSGGLFAAYNFNHFLKDDRVVSPILSFGISGFEFLSKSDLKDAEGRTYHYWDDGTIRDIDQNASNASQSVLLTRDYSYESDLRALDLDGLGDYSEKGLAFPIGIGAEFKMGDYLNLNIHTRYYLTSTDLIDNVTEQSVESRKGDARNDAFLYTGFVLRYGLHKKEEKPEGPGADLLATLNDQSDEDRDDVFDIVDQCPHTPTGVQVDVNGCPIDSDKDGVGDYADLEMDSAEDAYVDSDGVTITDEEFERKYKRFVGNQEVTFVKGTVESADIPDFVFTPRPEANKYMIKIDESERGISADLAFLLLSIPDVQTINNGDTTLYMVGDYDNLADAVRRKLSLEEYGIDGEVFRSDNGQLISESREAKKIRKDVKKGMNESDYNGEGADDLFWRVQVGAFKYKLSYNVFASISDVVVVYGDDGLTRYFSGVYNNRSDAEIYRQILQNSGFNDAFISAFQDGERMNVRNAKSQESNESSDDLWNRASPNAFNESLIEYKIMLIESDGTIPTEKLEQLREIGSVEQMTTPERTVYLTGDFDDAISAQIMVDQLTASGLNDAQVVGVFNGEVVTLEEVEMMKKN